MGEYPLVPPRLLLPTGILLFALPPEWLVAKRGTDGLFGRPNCLITCPTGWWSLGSLYLVFNVVSFQLGIGRWIYQKWEWYFFIPPRLLLPAGVLLFTRLLEGLVTKSFADGLFGRPDRLIVSPAGWRRRGSRVVLD